MKPAIIINILFVGALLAAPHFLDAYWIDVLNSIGLYAILALSLNIILGYAGLFHMGHAAFFAVGTYTTAILNTQFGIPVLWLMPLSGMAAGIFALLVARPIIHLRGDYLLIVTIGIVEIVRIALVNNVFGITGGANGIFGISRPVVFGYVIRTPYDFYYLILAFAAITVLLFTRLENSRFGRALNYIREDDVAAEGSGINAAHYKLVAFVIGAFWAGMVGTIFASKMTIVSPQSFTFWESVIMFTIVILGGAGNIKGVILGAFLIIGLPEVFREFAGARMLFFGAAMILMMIFRPKGILPPPPRTFNLDFLANSRGGGK
ncbi:branched-chain amino acid ABC transporter permease [Desulfonatronum parangueonense]